MFSIDCSLQRVGPYEGLLLVRDNIPRYLLQELTSVFNNNQTDQRYLLPLPTCARLVGVVLRPSTPFVPDTQVGGPDSGIVTVVIPL